jgi:GLPGLI family protein
MKKYLILSLLVLLCSKITFGQVLDSAYLKCVYKLTYVPDSLKPEKKRTDVLHLLIGKKVSTFFSYDNFRADSALRTDIQNGVSAANDYLKNPKLGAKYMKPGLYSEYRLFINYPKNKITTTDLLVSTAYLYEEKPEKISWKIEKDTATINGLMCRKATGDFQGRTYNAWFALQVPMSAGPYKFSGLPGLIVKIADTREHYSYELTAMEKLGVKVPIALDAEKYIRTSRKDFRSGVKKAFENPYQALAGNGTTIKGNTKWLQKSMPYNPIELF